MLGQQTDETFKVEKHQKPQLHVSSLEMKCMEQFRRRYIENEIIPPKIALIVGTGAHKGVDANMTHKIKTGKLLEIGEVADAARDGVNAEWDKGGVTLEPEELSKGLKLIRGEAVDKAVRLATLHHKEGPEDQSYPRREVVPLEINGYPFDLAGRIDIQEAGAVRDTKTSGKTPASNCAERSLQLKAYGLAVLKLDGKTPDKVALDYLIDTKTPKAESFEHSPDKEDFIAVVNRIEIIAAAMKAGIFVPVEPTHWVCDPKWCGFHSTCRYVRQPKQFAAA